MINYKADQLYATKKGDNFISFSSSRQGTLSLSCECLDMAFLALMLGGEYDDSQEKIEVTGDIPAKSFTGEGQFKVKTTSGFETKKIKFYNLSVQPTADISLSAADVSSFTLTLDVMVDETGKMLDIEKTV